MNEMNRHSTTYNWLVEEKSPYLQQHAKQPVNWYAWGDVALAKAKRENKPILLSVGYSTCHWCHVMAHESFDDPQVAALLNEHFVAIKVDREERPDIDSIYMRACQMMTGQGGWPLNVFLTPEQLPFYAGTYFPKEAKYGRIGFVDLLEQLTEKFTVERERIESIGQHLQQQLAPKRLEKRTLSKHVLERTALQLKHSFDSIYGGFSQAPKFPLPHIPSFLLHYARWQNDETALTMATKTLDSMASGGLYDVIGGGFARYSVDEMWLVPHFEKMLYDNGLLLYTYAEAYQLTKKPHYMKIVQELVAFVERELVAENGAFYSALDADSDGAEGTYYIWKASELKALLTDEQYRFVEMVFDVTEAGNFEGHNVLNSIHTNWANVPYSEQEVAQLTAEVKAILFAERAKRTYPHRDEKVTTAWNGYVLAGLAKAYAVTERESYKALAERAFATLEQTVWTEAWHVRYADGERSPHRFVDDQAAMLWAYVEWYRVTLDDRYLKGAKRTAESLHTQFWDEEMGGFFLTAHDGEALIVREKELYDGALPSGNSVALYALWQLSYLTDQPLYRQLVETMWATFTTQVEQYGTGHTFFLKSYLLEQLAPQTVHVAATDEAFADVFEQSFERLAPEVFMTRATADEPMMNGKPTFYVCRNEQCFPPSNEWNESV